MQGELIIKTLIEVLWAEERERERAGSRHRHQLPFHITVDLYLETSGQALIFTPTRPEKHPLIILGPSQPQTDRLCA